MTHQPAHSLCLTHQHTHTLPPLQLVAVDVRYGQLLGSVPISDSGATGNALRAVDGRGTLHALAVQALPGGRALVAVCGALLLVACDGVSARYD